MHDLVSSDWLAGELGSPDLALFDASFYLPAENIDATAQFAAAHVPGAHFFDINVIADPDSDLPHMVPSVGRFERLVGTLGIGNDTRVVFYDQKGLFSAARGWWLLKLFGHERVAVLDGGLPKWRREQRPVEQGAPSAPAVQRYRAQLRAARLRGLGDILDNLHTRHELLLDARPQARFAGRVPEPRPGLASGHIPGARSLPFSELLAADGTLRPVPELHALFASRGVDAATRVVTSCGSGVSATVITLALAVAGYDMGALYDGSWAEWGSVPGAPVETG